MNRKRGAGWLAPLGLALGIAAATGTTAPWAAGGSGPGSPSAGRAPGEGPMPDSVLARVTAGRVVTLPGFRAAWGKVRPPDRPDSLTPANARKFLDLLIEKEALAEVALRESWVWTDRESADYRATLDGLTMKVVLDSCLHEMRARLLRSPPGGPAGADPAPPLSNQDLGIAARESMAVALQVRFERDVLERLTRAFVALPRPSPDSTLFAQLRMINVMPEVEPADLALPVARTRKGAYTVGEVLSAWKQLSPPYRPRIEVAAQMEDVIENQLFERELRLEAERRRVAEWPEIAGALARKREFFAISHLVAREVYDRIPMDSTTLRNYFVKNRSFWDLPFRVALARFLMPTRQAAAAMAIELSDPFRAESLVAKGARARTRFMMEVSAESDSALFARALRAGPGSVLGPDSVAGGWEVARVVALQPGRPRSFEECRSLVGQRWYGVEGERLMVELLARARRQFRVVINEAALHRLTSS